MNSVYLREKQVSANRDYTSLIQLKLHLILVPDVCLIIFPFNGVSHCILYTLSIIKMLHEDDHSSDSSFEEDQAEHKLLVFVTGSSGKAGKAVVKYLSKHHSAKVNNLIILQYLL